MAGEQEPAEHLVSSRGELQPARARVVRVPLAADQAEPLQLACVTWVGVTRAGAWLTVQAASWDGSLSWHNSAT